MKIKPLNENGLLYNGVKGAELKSARLSGKSRAVTQELDDNSTLIATTEFVQSASDILKKKIESLKSEFNLKIKELEEKLSNIETSAGTTNPYVYKGSLTYDELPMEGNTIGDVYNVTDWHEDIPAGTNYAWTGEEWDPLGGDIGTIDHIDDMINDIFYKG